MNVTLDKIKQNMALALELHQSGDYSESQEVLECAIEAIQSLSPMPGVLHIPQDITQVYLPESINRCETIHHEPDNINARKYVTHSAKGIELSIQDQGRTAKLFIGSKEYL